MRDASEAGVPVASGLSVCLCGGFDLGWHPAIVGLSFPLRAPLGTRSHHWLPSRYLDGRMLGTPLLLLLLLGQ